MRRLPVVVVPVLLALGALPAAAQDCIECRKKVAPGIVTDRQLSRHAVEDVGCVECHGDDHVTVDDADNVRTVTVGTCALCHEEQFAQFKASKHALAWTAMKAMPTTHWKPMELIDGMKGCGGCRKIGLK